MSPLRYDQRNENGNILINTLLEGRKIVVDEKRAWLVNFTITGEGL